MRTSRVFAAFVVLAVMASAANACVLVSDTKTGWQIKIGSKPVVVEQQCRTTNVGVYDGWSLGPASDLGNGRIQQVIEESNLSTVLLSDCNTREATILRGVGTVGEETSCGPSVLYAPVTGEQAPMSLSVGSNLRELVELAAAHGITEDNPNDFFFTFETRMGDKPVGRKDRFDLLCGCKLFYPDSAGAKN